LTATFAVTVVNPVTAGVTQIANTATVADDGLNGTDPVPGNNSGSDTTPVTGAPDLSLTKSDGGASVAPGGTVAYILTYANTGNRGASGVVLTETVPANATFNAGASTAGWVCVPNNNAGSTCTLAVGSLAAGGGNQAATFAVTVANPDNLNLTVPAIGVITGAGTVTPAGALNFKMLANLHGGVAGDLAQVAGMSSGKGGIPFSIAGTTSKPEFVPDLKGVAGGMAGSALQGVLSGGKAGGGKTGSAVDALGGLFGKKKPQ
jgi:uncharacterized repeat protein (TIGR01451 family)